MKKFISLWIAVCFCAACTSQLEDLSTPFKAGEEVILSAYIGNATPQNIPNRQRVTGVDKGDKVDLMWDANDQVEITVEGKSSIFTLLSGAGSATGSFKGNMPANGSSYTVTYPVNYNESVLDNQPYQENGFAKGLMKMFSTNGTLDNGFTLESVNALLSFNLTGNFTLSKIVLTNLKTNKSYVLLCSGVSLTNIAKIFYFVLPAMTWENGFKLEIYDANGNLVKTLSVTTSITFPPASEGGSTDMPEVEVAKPTSPNALPGLFSIAEDKQVVFSKGNLQYTRSTNTWTFAENQYDYVVGGNTVEVDGVKQLVDKIDRFAESSEANESTKWGIGLSTNPSDYYGKTFVDWGNNIISGDEANTWYTMSDNRWDYVIWFRKNADLLRGTAQVAGANGLILLPDDFVLPDGITFKPGFGNCEDEHYGIHQSFSAVEWEQLESAGAVFLPSGNGTWGVYRTASSYYINHNDYYTFDVCYDGTMNDYCNVLGYVRLVSSKVVAENTLKPTITSGVGEFSISETKKVAFAPGNLQYTQSTDTWSFASTQYEFLGIDNVVGGTVNFSPIFGDDRYNGTGLADKIDMFYWSTSTTNFGVGTEPKDNSFVDWGTNKIGNDVPNTWRTLTRDEWYYLRHTRPNANDLIGIAQVNNVNGLILLPDNWVCPAGVTFKVGFRDDTEATSYATHQTFTADQWSKLETAGAVFLPATGVLYDNGNVQQAQYLGTYWTSSKRNYVFGFEPNQARTTGTDNFGYPVRLVKDL